MTQATEKKIRRLVEEESINWLLNQFTCDEDDIFASEALKEIFTDRNIEVNIETLAYLTDLFMEESAAEQKIRGGDKT